MHKNNNSARFFKKTENLTSSIITLTARRVFFSQHITLSFGKGARKERGKITEVLLATHGSELKFDVALI